MSRTTLLPTGRVYHLHFNSNRTCSLLAITSTPSTPAASLTEVVHPALRISQAQNRLYSAGYATSSNASVWRDDERATCVSIKATTLSNRFSMQRHRAEVRCGLLAATLKLLISALHRS